MTVWRVRTAITGATGGPQLATHFFDSTAGTPGDAATAVHGLWNDLKTYISDTFTMAVESLVYDINETTGLATGVHTVSVASVAGTRTGDPLPPFSQGLISWHTGIFLSGRELIGRTFIPAPCENDSTNGVPTSAYQSNVLGAGVNFLSGTASPCVYSRAHHTQSPVVSYGTPAAWAILKSRR